jgi:hypothetical protein
MTLIQNSALPLCCVSHFIYYYAECRYAECRDALTFSLALMVVDL